MALRLIELVLPTKSEEALNELLEPQPTLGFWKDRVSDDLTLSRILVPVEESERVLDLLEHRFSRVEGFKVILLQVQASLPRPESLDVPPPGIPKEALLKKKPAQRVSREELYADVTDTARLTPVYSFMVILSSIVAAIGLLQGNLAVVIGAMIIAPLLGPNVALALATTLGDSQLARKAMKTALVGIGLALVFSVLLGMVYPVDPTAVEIAARTRVGLADVALALASGSAGVLSFTAGLSTTLVGVMVAVALLPPLVTIGLLLGAGFISLAGEATMLLLVNLICVNLAGVCTFLAQGIQPLSWWELGRARRAARVAIIAWTLLLVILVVLILFNKGL